MTTQLEQDVKLAESVGFCHYSPSVYTAKKDAIHALCNAVREQALMDAAESHAESYEGDDRQDIKTDVMNAFFAGAKWQSENLEQEPVILACPFCGHKPLRSNLIDSLHPTGAYTHYINPQEPDEGLHYDGNPIGAIAEIWSFGCLTDEGGCGAEIMGEGKDGVIKKWNTRTSPPNVKAIRAAALMEAVKKDCTEQQHLTLKTIVDRVMKGE